MQSNAQRYLDWNKAFLNHFFKEKNGHKEVILYVDNDLINEIGDKNKLGNYSDFIKVVLIDTEGKRFIYDKIVLGNKRNVEVNRSLQKSIDDFPNLLKDIKSRNYHLIYFNYIIFYISIYVNYEGSSFYGFLNKVINKYLNETKKITSLNGLNDLFENLEQWSLKNKLGFFRARRIGRLTYKGLLNYQVVLKPEEHQIFDKILFTYGFIIDENATYVEFANKILPYTEHPKLRCKLKEGIENPVYAEWFLNRALQFDHIAYSRSEVGKSVTIQRKGTLIFNINSDHKLELLTDTLLYGNDKPLEFNIIESGLNNYGFYESPLKIERALKFEEQKYLTINKTLELKTIPIRGVTFFQKNGENYIQRPTPDENYECIVVVEKYESLWIKWIENPDNVDACFVIKSNNLDSIFGDGFLFYHVKNVKKAFYENAENLYVKTTFNERFKIKKLGGLKVSHNLYLDIGLPYFEIVLKDLNKIESLKHRILRNGIEDESIIIAKIENKYYLHINAEITVKETSIILIKFEIENEEKSFDFSITGTSSDLTYNDNLYKYDKWGDYNINCTSFLQGSKLNSPNLILLNNDKKVLVGLKGNNPIEQNYLIYLLVGISVNRKERYLRYKDVIKAIDSTLVYLKSKDVLIIENKYSKFHLINNLIALGYLNYRINREGDKEFQLMPFGLKKTEKSFNRISQVYQVTGVYSRLLLNCLKRFCEEHKIEIKYKSMHENNYNSYQSIMLPNIIYLDLNNKLNLLRSFIKDEFKHELLIEELHHLGDSLLNFIGSLEEFEKEHLNDRINLSNEELISKSGEEFPRIVETAEDYRRYGGYYSKKFLEKENGKYYRINHPYWTSLFVQNKRNLPVIFTKRTYAQRDFNYSQEILIPSRLTLPEIVYLTFCNLNHGIPITKKVFWKNLTKGSIFSCYTYLHFDYYNISDKSKRRENIARILTGSEDLDNNLQLLYCCDHQSKYKLYFVKCSIFSDFNTAILIKDDSHNIIGLYINRVLYININITLISKTESACLIIKGSDSQNFSSAHISSNLNENEILSKILDGKFNQFEFKRSKKVFNIDIIEEEKIEIRELTKL